MRCAASGTQSPVSGSRRISGPTYGCGVPSGPGTGAKRSGNGRGSSSRRVRSPETYAGSRRSRRARGRRRAGSRCGAGAGSCVGCSDRGAVGSAGAGAAVAGQATTSCSTRSWTRARSSSASPASVTRTSTSANVAKTRRPVVCHFVWSARTTVRPADSMSARFVAASSRFGVVSPISGSTPCAPTNARSTRSPDSAASASGPTSASDGVRLPPVRIVSRRGSLARCRTSATGRSSSRPSAAAARGPRRCGRRAGASSCRRSARRRRSA